MEKYNEVLLRRKINFDIEVYDKINEEDIVEYFSSISEKENIDEIIEKLRKDDKYIEINVNNNIIHLKSIKNYNEKKEKIEILSKELEELGYRLSDDFDLILYKNPDEILKDIISIVKILVGADKIYNLLNNGEEVEEKDEEIKVINLSNFDEYKNIINNLISSKVILSKADYKDIEDAIINYDIDLPDEIPLKETLIMVTDLCLKYDKKIDLSKYYKTTTDVYRLIVGLSGGDISLVKNSKIRNFKRREQRKILELLDNIVKNNKAAVEDMYKMKNRWIVAMYKLNPGVHKRYKNILKVVTKLRNNEKIETFTGKVNKLLIEDYEQAIELLKNKPGEFVRRLNELINKEVEEKDLYKVMDIYKEIVYKVDNRVLISVLNFFNNYDIDIRIFNIKSNVNKSYWVINDNKYMKEKFINFIIQTTKNAIIYNLREKEYMGNVYISENLKNYAVPSSNRTSNGNGRIIPTGSRQKINLDKISLFVHWFNNNKVLDIDLSCALFNNVLEMKEFVDYTNLKSKSMIHSGDVRNGELPNGGAEIIKIDISKIDKNIRYIVPQIYSFSNELFKNLNCNFGYMDIYTDKYIPKNVKMNMNITTEGRNNIPFIIDLKTSEIIYTDLDINNNNLFSLQSVRGQKNNLTQTIFNMLERKYMDLYSLIELNVLSRGCKYNLDNIDELYNVDYLFISENNLQEAIKEANEIRKNNNLPDIKVITPYDIDYIMSNLF